MLALFAFALALGAPNVNAQSLALIAPNKTELDKNIVSRLRDSYSGIFKAQDPDMTEAALVSTGPKTDSFNMTAEDARSVAAVLGCDFYILVRSGTQRRAVIGKPDQFESYAAFFVVSGRTGRLIKWNLKNQYGLDETDSQHRLVELIGPEFIDAIDLAWKKEPAEIPRPIMEQIPDADSTAAKNFRAPVPYLRIKPEYTRTAYLYDVTATVEATVDLDEKGQIIHIQISRWAGYGLDESVITAIRSMNWRPAERAGKPLPMRFLLRYNFKKLEKSEPNDE